MAVVTQTNRFQNTILPCWRMNNTMSYRYSSVKVLIRDRTDNRTLRALSRFLWFQCPILAPLQPLQYAMLQKNRPCHNSARQYRHCICSLYTSSSNFQTAKKKPLLTITYCFNFWICQAYFALSVCQCYWSLGFIWRIWVRVWYARDNLHCYVVMW